MHETRSDLSHGDIVPIPAQRLEEPLDLIGDVLGLPPYGLGTGQIAMARFEFRVVPEPLEHGEPGRDLARRGDLQRLGRAGSDRESLGRPGP